MKIGLIFQGIENGNNAEKVGLKVEDRGLYTVFFWK
jgi:hypothetical protein